MLINPEEVLKTMKHAEDSPTPAGEPKRLFKLNLNFGGKDRQLRKPASRDHKNSNDNRMNGQPFSSFFDGKSSLFSKKPPKPGSMSPAEKSATLIENDWTVV